jgi:hypothetical protein
MSTPAKARIPPVALTGAENLQVYETGSNIVAVL